MWLPPHSGDEMLRQIRALISQSKRKVVVLDDDPTGTQALRDVYVLTEWSVDALRRELQETRPLFLVLTNTRALTRTQAVSRHQEVAFNLQVASAQCGVDYAVVSRGDSTLRGHYPHELEALGDFDATILAPYFEEGGRYTFDDVQWVREGEHLVPVAQTVYARDQTFGYWHSNLRNWVEEKSGGRIRAADVGSISLEDLRRGGPDHVERVLNLARRQTLILNSTHYQHLQTFVLALLRAETTGRRFVIRSAASFLKVRAGQAESPQDDLTTLRRVHAALHQRPPATHGIIVVGSHTPRSTTQLEALLHQPNTSSCELLAGEVIDGRAATEVDRVRACLHQMTAAHRVIFTSRAVSDRAGDQALEASRAVNAALGAIVRSLDDEPRFIIAKGGWTASAVATDALNIKRAYAPLPITPGVPMWILGEEAQFPGLPYVIFPGNVGDECAIVEAVRKMDDLTGREHQ